MPEETPIRVRATTQEGYRFEVTGPSTLNGGNRLRKFFHARKEADAFAYDLRVRKENYGTRVAEVPERLRHEALECVERLKPFGATLSEATEFFIKHKTAAGRSCTVGDLITKVVEAKTGAERSQRYLADLRRIGKNFAEFCTDKFVSDVTPDDVERWVANRQHSATTRNNRLRTLSPAFSYAVKRRWCESNPVDRVERAYERKPVARYLNVEQARRLLQHANSEILPCVAIQLFAGLRPCELTELKFENIDLEKNQLWVDKDEHTTSHRVVEVMPNLHLWLWPYRSCTGPVRPSGYQKRWDDLRRQVGMYVNWPHDGLRHSYGTWHFALYQDLGKTAAQMGHSLPIITRRHYVVREDPSRARDYWAIEPKVSA